MSVTGQTPPFRPASQVMNNAHPPNSKLKEHNMNTIIYIVGLVVIIGAVLSYFGFR